MLVVYSFVMAVLAHGFMYLMHKLAEHGSGKVYEFDHSTVFASLFLFNLFF